MRACVSISTIIRRGMKKQRRMPTQSGDIARNSLNIESDENTLGKIKEFRHKNRVEGCDSKNLKAALVKLGLKLRRGKLNSLKPSIMLIALKQMKGDVTK